MSKRTTSVPAEAGRLYMRLRGRCDKSNPVVFENPVNIVRVTDREYADDAEPCFFEVVALWPSAGSITVRTVKHVATEQGWKDEFTDVHIYDSSTDDAREPDRHWCLSELEKEVNRIVGVRGANGNA